MTSADLFHGRLAQTAPSQPARAAPKPDYEADRPDAPTRRARFDEEQRDRDTDTQSSFDLALAAIVNPTPTPAPAPTGIGDDGAATRASDAVSLIAANGLSSSSAPATQPGKPSDRAAGSAFATTLDVKRSDVSAQTAAIDAQQTSAQAANEGATRTPTNAIAPTPAAELTLASASSPAAVQAPSPLAATTSSSAEAGARSVQAATGLGATRAPLGPAPSTPATDNAPLRPGAVQTDRAHSGAQTTPAQTGPNLLNAELSGSPANPDGEPSAQQGGGDGRTPAHPSQARLTPGEAARKGGASNTASAPTAPQSNTASGLALQHANAPEVRSAAPQTPVTPLQDIPATQASELVELNADGADIANREAAQLRSEVATTRQAAAPAGARLDVTAVASLAAKMAQRLHDGATRFTVRLDPPELGRVDVRLEVDTDGRARAVLAVERPEVQAELSRHSRDLERALGEAGVSVEEGDIEFTLTDPDEEPFAHEAQDNHNGRATSEDAAPETGDPHADLAPTETAEIDTPYGYAVVRHGRVDLQV